MPVLNEESYLRSAVKSVLAQDYPGEQELLLAVGPCTDSSLDVAQALAEEDPRVIVLENPKGGISSGLNIAIRESRHPVVIRVDAHSRLMPTYTARAVESLLTTPADNVGGVMRAEGKGTIQRAIARAYNSPIGLGGGRYHSGGEPGPAESAYLGVFWRESLVEAGGFDESVLRGEDWELNLRLRKSGKTVWFDPQLTVTYWPRSSFADLARQFFATGVWRAALVRRSPRDHPWRFFVPGLFVLSIVACLVIAVLQITGVIAGAYAWFSLAYLVPLLYLLLVLIWSVVMRGKRFITERLLTAYALVVMHIAWGSGFLVGIVRGPGQTIDRSRVS